MGTTIRTINLRKFKMKADNFDRGFVLKRNLNLRESRYLLKSILGIVISDRRDFCSSDEYKDYNSELVEDVNKWLKGDTDDNCITQWYAGDCGDESIGIWNAFKIAQYLINKNII